MEEEDWIESFAVWTNGSIVTLLGQTMPQRSMNRQDADPQAGESVKIVLAISAEEQYPSAETTRDRRRGPRMSLDLGRHDRSGGSVGRLFVEYRRQIGLMMLVFVGSFAITMIATLEPTTKIVIRHGIKDGVQFAERWCRRNTLWGATETPEIIYPNGSKSC